MCLLLCINIIKKKNKEINLHKQIISDLLNNFDNTQIIKLIKYCKEYITYTIDSKEINRSNKVKDNQKKYSILLELLESQAITNQFKNEPKATKQIANNVNSTFTDNERSDATDTESVKNKVKEKK